MDEQTKSPVPVQTQPAQIDFYEALKQTVAGKKVRRLEWEDKNAYGILFADGILMVHRDDKDYQWIIHINDMDSTDWVVVE